MSTSPRAQSQRRLSTESSGARWYYRSRRPSPNGDDLNLDLGRARDRAVERSTSSVRRDELFGLRLADAGDLERHRHVGEPVRLCRGARALDRDADTGHRDARVLGVSLDQRDAAGGDAREKRLAIRERVGLGPRRRVENELVTTGLVDGPADHPAAGRSNGVDLHITHVDPSSEAVRSYPAIYHTSGHLGAEHLFPGSAGLLIPYDGF